jgi:drug/metabolite transporter (DMT)-like permease
VVVAHIATSDEKITPAKLIGVVVGFVGVATMIGPDLLTSGESIVPQLACIAASLCYALAGVWARRFRPMGLKPLKVATAQLLVGALVMTPVSLTVAEPWIGGSPSLAALGAITVLALACTALGYVLYFRLIDSAGATNATLVTLLVPPIAILLGALFLGELLNGTQFLGFAFTALGLAVIDGRLIAAVRRKAFA